MNKVMILAILVAYKAFNDKSLTIATDEHVFNDIVIDTINNDTISVLFNGNSHCFSRTAININSIIGIQFQK